MLSCCCASSSWGAEKPLWELGLGVGGIVFTEMNLSVNATTLVRSHGYWAGGFGISWMVGKSGRRVDSDD
jgi:hypothetical protein